MGPPLKVRSLVESTNIFNTSVTEYAHQLS